MTTTLPVSRHVTPPEAARELLRRRRARHNLEAFTTYTKPDYEVNWHHAALCRYLDRFAASEIKRLMVFMPPQNGKSELVSRRLPAYIMGRNPNTQIIACSYSADLASRMNRDVQRIIDGPEYGRLFPEVGLNSANVRTVAQGAWLRNSDIFEIVGHQGTYRSAGVGGGITGMGFNVGIIDDPVKNADEAKSATVRESIWEWYTSTFYTRQRKDASILLTMTRWHEDDLAGRLLQQAADEPDADRWTVLSLPAVAGGLPNEDDPRQPGEPLWPARYSRDWLRATEATIGPNDWHALYQQTPRQPGGTVFQRDWWAGRNRYDVGAEIAASQIVARYISWDTGLKDKDTSAYSAAVVAELMANYRLRIRHVERERLTFPALPPAIERLATEWNRDGKLHGVLIEDKASGTSAIQTLRATAPSWLANLVIAFNPNGDKEYRAGQAAVWCRNGCIDLPKPSEAVPWLHAYTEELFGFPNVAYLDQVDATSQMIIYLEHYIAEGFRARGGKAA